MSDEILICKHDQTGFCKYRQQCTKEHVDEICKDNFRCKDLTCKKRHPKKCKNFDVFGKCKFTNCAYIHVDDGINNRVDCLEKYVKDLKEQIEQLNNDKNYRGSQKIDALEREVLELKDNVKKLTINLQATKLQIQQLEDKVQTDVIKNNVTKENSKLDTRDNWLFCEMCDYKCKKNVTLRKHKNTRHNEANYNCNNCSKTYPSKDMLEEHMKSGLRNEHEQQRDIDTVKIIDQDIKAEVSECSISLL